MIKRNLYTLIISGIIIVLSLFPVPEMKPLEDVPLIDKWTHLVMYAGMAMAMWLDQKRAGGTGWHLLAWSIVVPTLMGGMLELIQPSVGRSCDLMDFIADGAGAAIGTAIGLLAARGYKGFWSKRHCCSGGRQ